MYCSAICASPQLADMHVRRRVDGGVPLLRRVALLADNVEGAAQELGDAAACGTGDREHLVAALLGDLRSAGELLRLLGDVLVGQGIAFVQGDDLALRLEPGA